MRRLLPWIVIAGLVAAAGLAWRLLAPSRDGYEEPAYRVVAEHEAFEVRAYEPTIEAQVTMPGTREEATSAGFRVLAGYIFGGNRAQASIAMTTPVSAAPASQTIDMTAPVTAVATPEGWTVAFTMPSSWTIQTLPVPDDDRVRLVEVPGRTLAVRTFSGAVRPARIASERAVFEAALGAAAVRAIGPITVAQFDPPWVLGPWRRNELQVAVAKG